MATHIRETPHPNDQDRRATSTYRPHRSAATSNSRVITTFTLTSGPRGRLSQRIHKTTRYQAQTTAKEGDGTPEDVPQDVGGSANHESQSTADDDTIPTVPQEGCDMHAESTEEKTHETSKVC